jgi:phosphatidylethanolamine-binding protein (PEBP) family uncharacterized protein
VTRRLTELMVAVLLALGSVFSAARAAQQSPTPGPQDLVGPTTLTSAALASASTGTWSGVPSGARTVVLLMEDPDAKEPVPFVHWILYNLPARGVSCLRPSLGCRSC